ncbi:hypothetical protein [Flammeovirga agarivorans]|uniref:Uncharacterized protein n=1 Tax=Flammeovirga agarivorans TaxID=2726742 RepID=A0A7X8SRH2_9BACT|nr:hypothetical protein [Flammeovirga agarivorans]NLR95038.1 hypothetical protein [Flammeovirga agarivorans]
MKLPLEYKWILAHKFKGFTPWNIISQEKIQKTLEKEYRKETGGDILAFALREDCDIIAGFPIKDNNIENTVKVIHLTWSQKNETLGYPIEEVYENIFQWLTEAVIPLTKEWISEEELKEIEIN